MQFFFSHLVYIICYCNVWSLLCCFLSIFHCVGSAYKFCFDGWKRRWIHFILIWLYTYRKQIGIYSMLNFWQLFYLQKGGWRWTKFRSIIAERRKEKVEKIHLFSTGQLNLSQFSCWLALVVPFRLLLQSSSIKPRKYHKCYIFADIYSSTKFINILMLSFITSIKESNFSTEIK